MSEISLSKTETPNVDLMHTQSNGSPHSCDEDEDIFLSHDDSHFPDDTDSNNVKTEGVSDP